MGHFDLNLRWMSSLLRIAFDKESAHDVGHERRRFDQSEARRGPS
jgi:hypothetical protein